MNFNLTEIFQTAAHTAHSLRESPFANFAMHILGYAATMGLTLYLTSRRSKRAKEAAIKALTAQEVVGSQATITETYYSPTGMINEKTGNEFKTQEIRGVKAMIPLADIFNDLYDQQVLHYFETALPHCTPDEPDIFQHLHKVIPKPIFNDVFKKISSNWKAYFGALYAHNMNIHPGLLADDEVPEQKRAIALLVYEKGSTAKQFRIIVVHEKQLDLKKLPEPEDVLFEKGRTFVHDLNHGQSERVRIHRSIARAYNNGAHDIYDQFCFSYFTGKILKVEKPKRPDKEFTLPNHYERQASREPATIAM